jgi:adenylate cyclase
MGDDPRMADTPDGETPAEKQERLRRLRETARRTDARPQLVGAAKFLRRILPGDAEYGDPLSTVGEAIPESLGRRLADVRAERPSAVREMGLGALQAWQALSEAQKRGRGESDVTILFTDLVGFSSWALEAGDEAALELLRAVGAAEKEAISGHGGTLVKRLGDGAMAVFDSPDAAVGAALGLQAALAEIEIAGHTPTLRAGVHLGRPRKIGRDYLGVDVNIAARVGAAAKGDEVLVSQTACEALDGDGYDFGRKRRLKAAGAPKELEVCSIRRRS